MVSERLSLFCLSSLLTEWEVRGESGCSLHPAQSSSVSCMPALSLAVLRCGSPENSEKLLLFKNFQYYWHKKKS